jgi:hypothetical protein
MASVNDYSAVGRFKTDPDFKIVTRKGFAIATVTIMPVPVRSEADRGFSVPIRLQGRWDLLAHELLGDVGLRWVLMRHNRVDDPFDGPKAGAIVLIPSQAEIDYYLRR